MIRFIKSPLTNTPEAQLPTIPIITHNPS